MQIPDTSKLWEIAENKSPYANTHENTTSRAAYAEGYLAAAFRLALQDLAKLNPELAKFHLDSFTSL